MRSGTERHTYRTISAHAAVTSQHVSNRTASTLLLLLRSNPCADEPVFHHRSRDEVLRYLAVGTEADGKRLEKRNLSRTQSSTSFVITYQAGTVEGECDQLASSCLEGRDVLVAH